MADEQNDKADKGGTDEGTPKPDPANEPEGAKPEDEAGKAGGTDDGVEGLPDWAKERLSKADGEAKRYRLRLRETEEKLEKAKTPEEIEAVKAELQDAHKKEVRDLLVQNVALKHKLPAALAGRLKGETREELEADAKALAELFPGDEEGDDVDPSRLKGGLTPDADSDEDLDPRELAKKYRRR